MTREHTPDTHHLPHELWHSLPGGFADYLDAGAQLGAPIRDSVLDQLTDAHDTAPATIVDLGSGVGADAVALAKRYPEARVHAIDVSAELLEHVASRATAEGVTDRIKQHLTDLDSDWPAAIPQGVDLAWASLSLHHIADPAAVLQRAFDALCPGGKLVLTEFSGHESFTPNDLGTGRTGIRDRVAPAPGRPGADTDWAQLLSDAGFAPADSSEHALVAHGTTPAGAQFLAARLSTLRDLHSHDLTDDDLSALDAVIADLTAGTSQISFIDGRKVWIATRPETQPPAKVIEADAVVLGGGAAGLAASVALGRSRRRVVVIDDGKPRNAPADGAHNVLGNEGIAPGELLARGRAEAESYGVQILHGRATGVSGTIDDFTVDVAGSTHRVHARRIILATGLVDDLPAIPGIAQGWGQSVLHCPFCHGWEVQGERIGIISSDEVAIHQALLFAQLSDRVTVFLHEAATPTEEQREQLAALNVEVVASRVNRLLMDGSQVRAIELDGGRTVALDAVVVAPRFHARTALYEALGGIAEETPFGMQIPSDPRGMTPVPGVWAAGNSAQPMAMVVASAASGVTAGAGVHGDMAFADLGRAVQERRGESIVAQRR
ncbi:FAD-dependent oxidoreductase [Microbacterium sp.]|uniref:FAD-dependent oxidoreductase n=1 Tax=Microbacterium sp. TaxID=51671 RepID=UPI00262919BF|nr:FAD-dependent oxidoreductase [Microbacterium sp.]